MILNGKKVDFPAVCKISFYKVIEGLEQQVKDKDKNVASFAQNLLEELEEYPLLKEGFEDIRLIDKYRPIIDKLCRTLFPDSLLTNEIKAVTPPFYFKPLYTSTRFGNIFSDDDMELLYRLKDIDADTYYLYSCYSILGGYYGYPIKISVPMQVELEDSKSGLKRFYKMAFNGDLMEFLPTDRTRHITEEDYVELLDNFENIDLWKEKFPPDSWIMRGIGIMNLMDATVDQSLSSITSNLLIKSPNAFENIRKGIKNLYGNNEMEVGLVTFGDNEFVQIEKSNVSSIILSGNVSLNCKETMCPYTFKQLIERKEPLIIPNVEDFHRKSKSSISQRLNDLKIKSYIIAPLIYEDELLGFLELASNEKYELNTVSISKMDKLLPVLGMAAKKFKTDSQNQIEAIIQQECTTIHHSVKWRFETEAKKFLSNKFNKKEATFNDIIFKDVYPLYGQLDIKNSSSIRNEAVTRDLTKQIDEVKKILSEACKTTGITAYEELIFRIESYKKEIKKGLSAGTEHRVLEFLKSDIYPAFAPVKQSSTKLDAMVNKYIKQLDPELGTIYNERKKYDNSVNTLNHRLADFIDNKQIEAQRIFPHYFERYKTDGIEYNIYVGESISNKVQFDPIYLQNLRLWQLIVMCQMELEFKSIREELETAIEVASLILVYSTPLAVHFRMDEKRFDVEGAYNARYEIIKKRVDKAHIKGTKERITQPGHIAIIYSQEKDARDYAKYLRYLHHKGLVQKEFEDLELEDLQGITGLKALRAKVDYSTLNKSGEGYTVDELMETINGTTN
ncbi:MAG: GAF domain-containing protein [Cytophagales bacterium]|nr:GAF domain-containing protein [Cytophagales bacterium]